MQGWTEKCCLLAGYASNGKCSCRWCTRTGVRGGLLLRHAKLLPTLKQPKTPHSHLRTVFQLSHTPAPHCTLPSLQTHSPLNCLDLLTCTTHTHTLPTTHPLEQQHSIYAMPTNNLWHTHTPGHTHTDTHTPTHPHTHTHTCSSSLSSARSRSVMRSNAKSMTCNKFIKQAVVGPRNWAGSVTSRLGRGKKSGREHLCTPRLRNLSAVTWCRLACFVGNKMAVHLKQPQMACTYDSGIHTIVNVRSSCKAIDHDEPSCCI